MSDMEDGEVTYIVYDSIYVMDPDEAHVFLATDDKQEAIKEARAINGVATEEIVKDGFLVFNKYVYCVGEVNG